MPIRRRLLLIAACRRADTLAIAIIAHFRYADFAYALMVFAIAIFAYTISIIHNMLIYAE